MRTDVTAGLLTLGQIPMHRPEAGGWRLEEESESPFLPPVPSLQPPAIQFDVFLPPSTPFASSH